MSFVVRIFFIGLMAFVPSQDGKRLTVLLLDARDGYYVSDGTKIEPHTPLLLARAGKCEGNCEVYEPAIARFVFPEVSSQAARDSLSAALSDGSAWLLDASDLSLRPLKAGQGIAPVPLKIRNNPQRPSGRIPEAPGDEDDFRWVAALGGIDASAGIVDPDVLASQPQKGLIVARLRLDSGVVRSYRLVSTGEKLSAFEFQTLGKNSKKADYSQALADWVVAEIPVQGDAVEIVERRFGGAPQRSIKLIPKDGVVEVALMNVPQSEFDRSGIGSGSHAHAPGKHFEMYYELAKVRPPNRLRPVPYTPSSAAISETPSHQRAEPPSLLLEALRLDTGRGPYNWIICPVAQLSEAGSP